MVFDTYEPELFDSDILNESGDKRKWWDPTAGFNPS